MKCKSDHVELHRKLCGLEHVEDIRDFQVKNSWEDERLEGDIVQEDEVGEWEDFDRLKLTEGGNSQVKLTVNPEFKRQPSSSLRRSEKEAAGGSSLEFDSDAYKLLHRASVEWSCLSSDVFREPGGTEFPYTIQVCTGSKPGNGQHRDYVQK
jgi:hypothetical protein